MKAWQETFRHFGKEIPVQKLRQQIGKGGDQYLPDFLNEKEMREIGKPVEEFRGKIFRKNICRGSILFRGSGSCSSACAATGKTSR